MDDKKSTMYQLMRLSESHDDDGMDEAEAIDFYLPKDDFATEYKKKYTDIKTSTKDDW